MASLAVICAAVMLAQTAMMFAAGDSEIRRCEQCNAAIVDQLEVVVTDFAAQKDHSYCNCACAISAMMDKFPTSRAIAHDPFAGKEVRVIRTGAKWIAWPQSAVFLYLLKPDPQAGADADAAPGPRVAETCLAFPRQVEYIQYLATHPEVSARCPRPLRLAELLKKLKEPGGAEAGPT
ncbi:MAG TPA: hypothetical protein VM221_11375 [Armatimonadota bacterium]|nr:hypothetical protein [Armatimonadota bacterium]